MLSLGTLTWGGLYWSSNFVNSVFRIGFSLTKFESKRVKKCLFLPCNTMENCQLSFSNTFSRKILQKLAFVFSSFFKSQFYETETVLFTFCFEMASAPARGHSQFCNVNKNVNKTKISFRKLWKWRIFSWKNHFYLIWRYWSAEGRLSRNMGFLGFSLG